MKKLLSIALILAFLLIVLTACNGDNGGGRGQGGGTNPEGILGAWHRVDPTGENELIGTLVFNENGTGVMFRDVIYWRVENGILMARSPDDAEGIYREWEYEINRNTLTLTALTDEGWVSTWQRD